MVIPILQIHFRKGGYYERIPKTLKTKEDYYNCLAMVAAGELDAADLERKIDSLENSGLSSVPL